LWEEEQGDPCATTKTRDKHRRSMSVMNCDQKGGVNRGSKKREGEEKGVCGMHSKNFA